MQQSIRYKGLSLTPDEMAVENGALSLCGNLELHDGALRPTIVSGTTLPTSIMVDNPGDTRIVYVHEASGYKHFVGYYEKENSLHWFDEDGTYMDTIVQLDDTDLSPRPSLTSVTSVGNTLVIITTSGIVYALFQKNGNAYGDYLYLGQKPPFIELSFSVETYDHPEDYELGGVESKGSKNGFYECFQQTTYSPSDCLNQVQGESWKSGDNLINIKEDKQSDLTQSIYALINRTNNLIARKGRFYANFFVRYCYRMFDGSMVMHSAPVFIPVQVPNNYSVALLNSYFFDKDYKEEEQAFVGENHWFQSATFNRRDAKDEIIPVKIGNTTFCYSPRNVALQYSLSGDINELKKWNDIIKSIDIFISAPVTNIDTSEKISTIKFETTNYGLGSNDSKGGRDGSKVGVIRYVGTNRVDGIFPHDSTIGYAVVDFPTISDDAYANKLKNTSAFYKISSLKVSELEKVSNKEVPVDKAAIYQVTLQEQMKDDYKTHNALKANGGYVYNHRLNLFGVKEKLFDGYSRNVMLPGAIHLYIAGNFMYQVMVNKIVVVLNTSSGKKYVEKDSTSIDNLLIEPKLLVNSSKYYPDSRAEKMVFFTTNNKLESAIYAFELEACEELNGAIFMGTFMDEPDKYKIDSFDYTIDNEVEMSNKIYTSESDNAFYFPLNGINTVGIGTIQGIASTTRALSQGQFGQYPLMAFSTDGIWAMEVSSQGTYSSIHPISREVCSNPKSITQLDQSVLFATNRSLSRIAESQVASMSDVLDGPGFKVGKHMVELCRFFEDSENDNAVTREMKAQMRQLIDFTSSPIDFFQKCQVIYDYKNSRIFCLDVSQKAKDVSADTVALCYSIKDEAWCTFLIKNVLTALNSYPHPYIQYRDGSVIALDSGYDYKDETEYHGIIVTRTLKFDEENAPDAITGYIHSLASGSVPVMWLYGSNDNQNWHYLGRCGGMKSSYMSSHSYRFFRIALYLKMKSMNQYFATRLEVIRRFNKF